MTCVEFRVFGAEFALGVLDARERAFCVGHLESCERCREEMRELAGIADGLASLAPAVEPPSGFESRVLETLRNARRDETRRDEKATNHRRRAPFVAIAAAFLVIAGFVGWALRGNGGPSQPALRAELTAVDLTSGHRVVGEVVINRSRSWLSMTLDLSNKNAWVTCDVITTRGRTVAVGSFRIVDGRGFWSAPLRGPMTIDGARVVGYSGATLASSDFSALRIE
jgi:anti-sigma-K factor RskA